MLFRSGEEIDTLAAVAAVIDHLNNTRRRHITQQMSGEAVRFARHRVVRLGKDQRRLDVAGEDGMPFYVTFVYKDGVHNDGVARDGTRGQTMEVASSWWPGDPIWTGRVGDREISVQVKPLLNGVELSWRGITAKAWVYTEREAELAALMPEKAAADTSKLLLCPMPGLIKSVSVALGQVVKAGDTLAVVEAMKMENVLRAERDGTVKKINAKAGESLAVDAVIMEFA